jgi:hypothetical protein
VDKVIKNVQQRIPEQEWFQKPKFYVTLFKHFFMDQEGLPPTSYKYTPSVPK